MIYKGGFVGEVEGVEDTGKGRWEGRDSWIENAESNCGPDSCESSQDEEERDQFRNVGPLVFRGAAKWYINRKQKKERENRGKGQKSRRIESGKKEERNSQFMR